MLDYSKARIVINQFYLRRILLRRTRLRSSKVDVLAIGAVELLLDDNGEKEGNRPSRGGTLTVVGNDDVRARESRREAQAVCLAHLS